MTYLFICIFVIKNDTTNIKNNPLWYTGSKGKLSASAEVFEKDDVIKRVHFSVAGDV